MASSRPANTRKRAAAWLPGLQASSTASWSPAHACACMCSTPAGPAMRLGLETDPRHVANRRVRESCDRATACGRDRDSRLGPVRGLGLKGGGRRQAAEGEEARTRVEGARTEGMRARGRVRGGARGLGDWRRQGGSRRQAAGRRPQEECVWPCAVWTTCKAWMAWRGCIGAAPKPVSESATAKQR